MKRSIGSVSTISAAVFVTIGVIAYLMPNMLTGLQRPATATPGRAPQATSAPNVSDKDARFREFVPPNLKFNLYAVNAAKFLVGHIEKNFDLVVQNSWTFQRLRQELSSTLPPAIAQSRFNQAVEQGRQEFLEEKGPFRVWADWPLPAYFFSPSRLKFQVVHLAATQAGITTAFVEVEYLQREGSPLEYIPFGLRKQRPLKKVMMSIWMRDGFVLSDERGISLVQDAGVTQYWESFPVAQRDQLLKESITRGKELYKFQARAVTGEVVNLDIYDTEFRVDYRNVTLRPLAAISSRRMGSRNTPTTMSIWFGDIENRDNISCERDGESRNLSIRYVAFLYEVVRFYNVAEESCQAATNAFTAWSGKYKAAVDENPDNPIVNPK